MPVIDELLVSLGYEYDPKQLEKFNKDVDSAIKTVKRFAAAAASAAVALTGMTVASTRSTYELSRLSDELNINIETIDALQFAMQQTGGSAEAMSGALRNLTTRASEAALGMGSGVSAFGMLGISVTDANGRLRPTEQLLLDVSRAIQGLDKGRQIDLAGRLGLGGTVRLLQEGPQAIRKLMEEAKLLGVTTEADAEIAKEFQAALVDLWQIIKQISRTIAAIMAPILSDLVNLFKRWWLANRELIQQNLPYYIDLVTTALRFAFIALSAFVSYKIIAALLALRKAVQAITLSTLAMNAAIAALPTLIVAALTALYLLIDDLIIFFKGGDSFIGALIERFPILKTAIDAVGASVKAVYNFIVDIVDKTIYLLDKVKDSLGGRVLSTAANVTSTVLSAPANAFNFVNDRLFNRGGGSSNTNTNVDRVEIIINGGNGSPQAIAEAVSREFQQAARDLSSAVEQ